MIKEAVATGATIEEAQQAAVLSLNAPISAEVQFEVISLPEKKKFGLFGGKPAEVRAFYEAKDEKIENEPVKNSQKKRDTKKEIKKKVVEEASTNADTQKSVNIEEEKTEEPVKAPATPVSSTSVRKVL